MATKVQLKEKCSKHVFYSYGTIKIFEKRAQKLSKLRIFITFLGIAVPLSVGSLILSFGKQPDLLPYLVWPAGIIGTMQLIMSVWSLVARWDEAHSHAMSSVLANTRLYNAWVKLEQYSSSDLEARINELEEEDQRQEQLDLTQHLSDKEKRYAMRSSLIYFQRECVVCGVKPISIKPSKCDTCGNF